MATGNCATCGEPLVASECRPCAALLPLLLRHPPAPCRLCRPTAGEAEVSILPALGSMEVHAVTIDAAVWDCHRCGAVRKMPLGAR